MALEGTDLLVVQKQTGDNGMRKLSITDLSTFLDTGPVITFKGTANGTISADEPEAADRVAGNLYINDAETAGTFAWSAGTNPFTGTIYPNANIIWQDTVGWQVTNNQGSVDVGVTAVTGSLPITVNSDNAAAPNVSVNAAASDGSTSGVVTIATNADVAAGTANKVVTSAQLKDTNDAISAAGGGTVTNVTGTAPIQVASGTTTPAISIDAGTFTEVGAVKLQDDSVSAPASTVDDAAATPKYVDSFYLIKDFSTLTDVEA